MENLLSKITAFEEKEYYMDQILPEYINLEKQLYSITFGENIENKTPYLLQDVADRFTKIYNNNKLLLEDEYKDFLQMNRKVIKDIMNIKQGNKGEYLVQKTLDRLNCKKIVLHNKEFYLNGHSTEIDSIVITEKGIFIIEVKHYKNCEVHIDNCGDMYKITDRANFKVDLLEKMEEKEFALRKSLEKSNVRLTKIHKIVVFIDSNCNVKNECREFFATKLQYLNKTIERCNSMKIYSLVEMDRISNYFKNNVGKRKFAPSVNIEAYKRSFVNLYLKTNEVSNMSKIQKLLKVIKIKISNIFKKKSNIQLAN